MRNSPDPSIHRQREQQFMAHVDRLLDDERLRVDTVSGRRPVPSLGRRIIAEDREVELKRLMLEMNKPDRDLQSRMPVGRTMTVELWRSRWFVLRQTVGRMKVFCISPTRELLGGQSPNPVDGSQLKSMLAQIDQLPVRGGAPTTLVVMSTSGFSLEAHEAVDRRADRTLILVEPNDKGGWTVTGPSQTQALADLFDPEGEEDKRQRIRNAIEAAKSELVTGALSAEKVCFATQLPAQLVELELKSYAKANTGLVAKRIDGRLLLFRDGYAPSADSGGPNMPFWEKVKGIFRREETMEQKLSKLAAERAGLTQQREKTYEEITSLETRELDLTKNFASATALAQRRIATEISQLRKDMERRQQILGAIDKKINIINTGMHNLQMQQQVDPTKLQTLEQIAQASEDVEAGLATLQQLDEEANAAVAATGSEVSDDVQAIMDELKAKAAAEPKKETVSAEIDFEPPKAEPAQPQRMAAPPPLPGEKRKSEPEAG